MEVIYSYLEGNIQTKYNMNIHLDRNAHNMAIHN